MTRMQPPLTKAESTVVDQLAELTQTKRTDVLKNALAVYSWFVRQAVTGARVIARKPTGEEVTLETPELCSLESRGSKLSPRELGVLAKKLSQTRSEERRVGKECRARRAPYY